MKKFYHRAAILVILAVASLLLVSLTGCGSEVNVTTASLSEATMCRSIDVQTKQPIEKADVFTTYTPIYCSVKLSNAPPLTEVKAVWIYVQGEAKDLEGSTVGEFPITADGTRYLLFSITPTKETPIGDYVVKLFLDGKEKLTVPFKVQSGTATTVRPSEVPLANIFQETAYGYTIQYPADWEYQIQGSGDVIFIGKQGAQAPGIMEIQTLAGTKMGGDYENVDAVMNMMINAIKAADTNAQITKETQVSFTDAGGQQVIGKYCDIAYTYKGQKLRRLVVAIPYSIDGEAFHLWYYEYQSDGFNANLPTVQAILTSWTLTK